MNTSQVPSVPQPSADPPPPNVTVSITFPAAWLTPIYNHGEDALLGRDLYWMKQLMAKIAIAAAHSSKHEHQLRLESEDGEHLNTTSPSARSCEPNPEMSQRGK